MKKIRFSIALIIIALMTVQVPRVLGADNGQTLLLKKSFPTESGERLKVNAYSGNVKINSWHKNEIEIKIYGTSEAGTYLDFDVSSDELGIMIGASKKVGIEKIKNLNLTYEISIPRDYSVQVTTGSRNVIIEDKNAPVEISAPGGKVSD